MHQIDTPMNYLVGCNAGMLSEIHAKVDQNCRVEKLFLVIRHDLPLGFINNEVIVSFRSRPPFNILSLKTLILIIVYLNMCNYLTITYVFFLAAYCIFCVLYLVFYILCIFVHFA